MLEQSLPINSIIVGLKNFCNELRKDTDNNNLVDFPVSAAAFIDDLARVTGIPAGALRMILTSEELDEIGVREAALGEILLCQHCGMEEAIHLVPVRGTELLLCADCENTLAKGKK